MKQRLKFVGDDGITYGFLSFDDVRSLSTELMYTIDYRPSEYPEYADLKETLDTFLDLNK